MGSIVACGLLKLPTWRTIFLAIAWRGMDISCFHHYAVHFENLNSVIVKSEKGFCKHSPWYARLRYCFPISLMSVEEAHQIAIFFSAECL